MSYIVKAYARNNGICIDTQYFATLVDAQEYFQDIGSGEGYWTEILRSDNGVSVCVASSGI